jgi:glycerol-3-phosphate dehydrogenase
LLTVYGGKITTYRRLAEQALRQLAPCFPGLAGPWTAQAPLPGGDLPGGDVGAALATWQQRHPWMPAALARRWLHAHGSRADRVLGDARGLADLGRDFGATLSEREVVYLLRHEWARTAEDILWRRTRCGLHMSAAERSAFAAWIERFPGGGAAHSWNTALDLPA